MTKTVLTICATCKTERDGKEAGRMLIDAVSQDAPVEVREVECLSNCSNGCTIALSAPGKWSYVYGGVDPKYDIDALQAFAAAYAATEDGVVPWKERPQELRRKVVARVPAL